MDSSIFLLIVVVVIAVLLIFAIVLLVVLFGHPDDKNAAYFPKAVTVFGLWLAFASLLVLPYDVAVSSSGSTGVRVDILWQVVYIAVAILISALVPFAFFFYESDVDDQTGELGFFETQLGSAIKYTLGLAAILVGLLMIMYSYLNTAEIPVTRISYQSAYSTTAPRCNPSSSQYVPSSQLCFPLIVDITTTWVQCSTESAANLADLSIPHSQYITSTYTGCMNNYNQACPANNCVRGPFTWDIPVSFPLYVICFVAFIGWFFFVCFAGVGFIGLPMDLINDYRFRPTPISTKTYFEERTNLGRRAAQLLETGEKLQRDVDKAEVSRKDKRANNSAFATFERNYFFLQKDYQMLRISYQLKGGNPLVYIAKLVAGVGGIGLSVSWLLHIIIFMLPAAPLNPFLNSLFVDASDAIPGFSLFGVICFALWSFYLLMCVVFGNFKLGVRFLLFKMYPMEYQNTLMNAFLFNTWIILFTCIPAAQFCVYAFPYYTANTQAQVMFGNQVRYLQFFKYFYLNNVFIIALIVVAGLTGAYLAAFPNNKAAKVDKLLEKIAKSSSTSVDPLDIDMKIR